MSAARKSDRESANEAPPSNPIAEVRYSLPQMLAELKIERAAAFFAMEKLEQSEIKKAFKNNPQQRVNIKKQSVR